MGVDTDAGDDVPRIVDFIERWNHEHGDVCRIRMATLSQFFERLRKSTADIPVHRGDWPDWWSDGCAGDPESTMLFRRAQRTYEYYLRLLERYPDLRRADTRALEDELALYSEHTFGHSFSMIEPWHFLVHAIAERKRGFAASAHDNARELLGYALEEHGVRLLSGDAALADDPAHAYAWLMTNYWETNFAAELGGFYEFRYSVMWGDGLAGESSALSACRDASWDIHCLRLKREAGCR